MASKLTTRQRNTGIKHALQQKFPGTKFSVRESPMGTEAVWTDGPKPSTVQDATQALGEPRIHTVRNISPETWTKAEAKTAAGAA